MSTSTKVSVTIPAELLGQIDDIRFGEAFSTRSGAITYILEEELRFWCEDELAGYHNARTKGVRKQQKSQATSEP